MNRRQAIIEIGARVPQQLRDLRGRLLLEACATHMGISEVECSACGGRGLLDGPRREFCPICMCFQVVPKGLADWFEAQMLKMRCQQGGEVLESAANADCEGEEADEFEPAPLRPMGRPGRFAEILYCVSQYDLLEATCGRTWEDVGF